jgi:hypothetical protein
MRFFLITILIALIPISSLFIVNETVRNQNKPSGSLFNGAKRINGGLKLKHKCTWACHEGFEVIHCRKNHIKYLNRFDDIIFSGYRFITISLDASGNYYVANILVFVVFLPLFILIMLIKTLQVTYKIKEIQKRKYARSI